MFLSSLLINVGDNPDRPDWAICRRWLRDPYRVHQRLCMGFPSKRRRCADPEFLAPWAPNDFAEGCIEADSRTGGADAQTLRQVHAPRDEHSGFLFRIDPRPGGSPVILVQSATEPDWGYAFHNADYLLAACPEVKRFAPTFTAGQRLLFRLRANPTKKLSDTRTGKSNGVRVGLYTEDEQRAWLDRKGRDGGFRVLSCEIISEGKRNYYKGSGDCRRKMPLLSVRFDGTLEVTDPQRFAQTLRGGIGSAKAFGFGLLSVARA